MAKTLSILNARFFQTHLSSFNTVLVARSGPSLLVNANLTSGCNLYNAAPVTCVTLSMIPNPQNIQIYKFMH